MTAWKLRWMIVPWNRISVKFVRKLKVLIIKYGIHSQSDIGSTHHILYWDRLSLIAPFMNYIPLLGLTKRKWPYHVATWHINLMAINMMAFIWPKPAGELLSWQEMSNQARRFFDYSGGFPQLKKWRNPVRTTFINISPLGQNGRHFTDDVFRCIFVIEMFCILIKMSLNLFLMVQLIITEHWLR